MRRRSFDLALGVGGYPDSTSPGTVAALERRLLDTGVPALLVPGPSEADVVSRDGLLACPTILEPIPELLLVVLDTTSGRVDEPTRRWLDTELTARRREHRFCLVASGHAFFEGEGVPAAALLPNVADRIAVGEIVQRHKIDGLLCGGASDYVVTSSSPPQVLCGAGDEMVARVSLGGHRPLVIARERLIPSTEYGASLASSIGRAEGWLELLRRRGAMAVAFVIALSWAAAIPAWWLGALVARRERRPRR